MKVGDLVCLRGTAVIGVVLEFVELNNENNDDIGVRAGWAFVMWPSDGKSLEKTRDLEVIHNP